MPQFIETQFPIARLSAESFKERKAVSGQTLTGLGKWWGRKPLILCRATIIGMLMPASDDPRKDRDIFLKILTMDDDGTWRRCAGEAPLDVWRQFAAEPVKELHFVGRRFKPGLDDEEKADVLEKIWEAASEEDRQTIELARRRPIPDRREFELLAYSERIKHCLRPEQVDGPSVEAWRVINDHLKTSANSISELVLQLGVRQFGNRPRVGDAFCGGGSVPFEAARIGCEAYASDLNPVAGLLTWANINLLGSGKARQREIQEGQLAAFERAKQDVEQWGIEKNSNGEQAEAFVYCVEVKPEGSEYYIPLSPSWIVDEYLGYVVDWIKEAGTDRLRPIVSKVHSSKIPGYKERGKATVVDGRIIDPFDSARDWSLESIRGPSGLRHWTNNDITPAVTDVFQERLYCIRWGSSDGKRRYAAPAAEDIAREELARKLLLDRLSRWQASGFIPSMAIPKDGSETERLYNERGWSFWHHLFTARQLLVHGAIAERMNEMSDQASRVAGMLNIGRIADWDSRLSCWLSSKTQIAGGKNTFLNQALNSLFNYPSRPISYLKSCLLTMNSVGSFSEYSRVTSVCPEI